VFKLTKTMRYFLIFLFSFLTACGSSLPVLKPYKMDIQQGNVVTSKMLLQLKPGMTKSQVRFIMGTPLVVDSFHKDRWDYFYQLRQSGKVVEQRRVILDFEKDLLARVRGDVVPQGTAGADTGEVALSKPDAAAKKAEEEGVLDKLKFWKDDKKEAVKPEAPKKPEKSLWESMKFWKKDEATPEAKPLETKPAEAAVAAEPSVSAGEAEAPSVLAVPVPIGAAGAAPAIEVPKVEMPQVEAAPAQMPQGEPAQSEPIVATPVVEPVQAEAPKATPEPVPVVVPEKVETERPEPAPLSNAKQDEKLIFRLDRTLNLKLLEQEMAPKPIVEPTGKSVTEPKNKANDTPLPAETEPGYFERMLEKIGF
jgi:outer membrane protein assembly factor BamE